MNATDSLMWLPDGAWLHFGLLAVPAGHSKLSKQTSCQPTPVQLRCCCACRALASCGEHTCTELVALGAAAQVGAASQVRDTRSVVGTSPPGAGLEALGAGDSSTGAGDAVEGSGSTTAGLAAAGWGEAAAGSSRGWVESYLKVLLPSARLMTVPLPACRSLLATAVPLFRATVVTSSLALPAAVPVDWAWPPKEVALAVMLARSRRPGHGHHTVGTCKDAVFGIEELFASMSEGGAVWKDAALPTGSK